MSDLKKLEEEIKELIIENNQLDFELYNIFKKNYKWLKNKKLK
jgi:hypothetical protein